MSTTRPETSAAATPAANYEPVIGLEVHVELATRTKLFCGCSTRFGAEPNTQTCPVCLGLPGVLPVVNRRAFEYVVRTALALECRIARRTSLDRKNYYYPDLPKNYQISQNYTPIGVDGYLEIPVNGAPRRIGIRNVHLEEDAGKLFHLERGNEHYSLVDLNRAGVPLMEIVTAPDMHEVKEVESFMLTLRSTLLYLGVSDCQMQEGKLRFEASVSVRPAGQTTLGSRVEIKNLNSISAVLKAVAYEIERQTRVLREGGQVAQETRLWNEAAGRSERMRTKEAAHDYRYFPEPDLVPMEISDAMLAEARRHIPELPARRRMRFVREYGLSDYDAGVLTDDRALADFFEAAVEVAGQSGINAPAKLVCNWVTNQLLGLMNARGLTTKQLQVTPAALARLVGMVSEGKISAANARDIVLVEMVDEGTDPEVVVQEKGLAQISDASTLEGIVAQVIAANPTIVADYRKGKQKAFNALVGAVMRQTRGKASPQGVQAILTRLLGEKN